MLTATPGNLPWVPVDTSVVVDVLRSDPAMVQRYAQINPVISATVLGELLHGVQRARRSGRQNALIANLLSRSHMVSCDEATAPQYATIRHRLEQQGTRIPENDIWIAATAAQHQLTLATRDPHFRHLHWMLIEQS